MINILSMLWQPQHKRAAPCVIYLTKKGKHKVKKQKLLARQAITISDDSADLAV